MESRFDLQTIVAVRSLLARAYANDPLMRWVFPEPTTRTDSIAAWLGLYLERHAEIGHIRVMGEDPPVAVIVGRDSALPRRQPDTFPSIGGVLRALVGQAHARDVLAFTAKMASLGPQEPSIYLQYLAVDPEAQGSGYGRKLLLGSIEEADEVGKPIKLETTNPVNVDFYRKFGFTVEDEMQLGEDGPTSWSMWRPVNATHAQPSSAETESSA